MIYFILNVLRPMGLPFPEAMLVLWGSTQFGSFQGFVLGTVGSVIGLTGMYLLAKRFMDFFMKREKIARGIANFRKYIYMYRFMIVGVLFVVPVFPDIIVCVGAAATGVSLGMFFPLALLAKTISVGMVAYSKEISNLLSLNQWTVIIIETGLLLLSAWILRRHRKATNQNIL